MPSAKMNRILDNARVRLPGALDSAILAELFNVMDDFCRRTNVWQEDFDIDVLPTTMTYEQDPDAFTYQIFPPAGAVAHRLIHTLNTHFSPIRASMPVYNHIVVGVAPSEPATYKVRVSLTVDDPVTRTGEPAAPAWLIDKHYDTLTEGVVARMMTQTAKPYSNLQMAAIHASLFTRGVSTARIEASRANVNRGTSWMYPQTYASGRRR